MDNKTREAAIYKAKAITDMIGFPEFILDKNQVWKRHRKNYFVTFYLLLDKHCKKPAVVAERSKALSQIQVERMP